MANILFTKARELIANHNAAGTINLLSDTLKVMLVDDTYVGNADDQFVDDGTANDPASHEISVSGYTGGFGGAGRKTLAGKSIAPDFTDDVAYFDANDVTWTALGAGATIGAALLIREGTNDADSRVIAKFDVTDTPTNGGDVTLVWHADGLLQF